MEDFLVGLQNPENTLGEEWDKESKLSRCLRRPEPFSSKRLALDWLKLITDQTFDSPTVGSVWQKNTRILSSQRTDESSWAKAK